MNFILFIVKFIELKPIITFKKIELPSRGVVLKKKWGTPETRLRQRFLNNLGLHTRTLIHVRKIATVDIWSCPAIELLVFECL